MTARPKIVSPAPPEETKHAKFLRLAQHRIRAALKRLDQIGNLGSSIYESSESEREKIVSCVREAVDEMELRLAGRSQKQEFTW